MMMMMMMNCMMSSYFLGARTTISNMAYPIDVSFSRVISIIIT
jgi:hypothetical protein